MGVVGWGGVLAYFGVYVFLFWVLMLVYREVCEERGVGWRRKEAIYLGKTSLP